MENQIYRLEDGTGKKLEFWVFDTNDVQPLKDTKEIGITLEIDKDDEIYNFDLDKESTKSLIKYLKNSLKYVTKFNKQSPIIEEGK